MKKIFDDLPEDAQERIRARNNFSDELAGAQIASTKADFLTRMLKCHYMDEIPTDENQFIWVHNRERICMFVDIIQDYTFMAQEELTRIENQLTEMNVADGWVGLKDA